MFPPTNPPAHHVGEIFSAMSANMEDGAQSDITADGFWGGRFEWTFFDVRVFMPLPTTLPHSPVATENIF